MAEIDLDVTADVVDAIPEEEIRICLFSIGEDVYAVPVEILTEIIIPQKIFPVPTTPPHVLGVINLRGNIVPIVDIRSTLSLPQHTGVGQIAIIRHEHVSIGIVVDNVSEVISVPESSLQAIPPEIAAQDPLARSRTRYLKAVVQRETGAIALLDIGRIYDAIKLA